MQNDNNKYPRIRLQRDIFGVLILCRLCRSLGFRYDHHPIECKTCYECGEKGHLKKNCPLNNKEIPKTEPLSSQIRSAKKHAIIDNSAQLREDDVVSIDIEKVLNKNNDPVAGWVVIFKAKNHSLKKLNRLVYSAKITRHRFEVNSYVTRWSGLTEIDLSAHSIEIGEVRRKVKEILKDRKIVGIGLKEDLECLGLDRFIPFKNRVEFKDIYKDEKGDPIALKQIAYAILGKKIQEYSDSFNPLTGHDPTVDARICIDIYNKMKQPGNGSIDNHYQWIRNIVYDAKEFGLIKEYSYKK